MFLSNIARVNMLLSLCHTSTFLPIILAAAIPSSLGLTLDPEVILSSPEHTPVLCTASALAFTNQNNMSSGWLYVLMDCEVFK